MESLRVDLLPYQKEAVNWCYEKESKCCILAYEMGLGKTVITTAVIAQKPLKTLVMVPASLLNQWNSELNKFIKNANTFIYHGNNKSKRRIENADIILSTPAIIANEMRNSTYSRKFKGIKRWVIDEAHKLRNMKSKTYKGLKLQSTTIQNKIFLTGTPICNTSSDLISLICLSNYEVYNDMHMWKNMTDSIRYKQLESIIPDVLLRRTKIDTISCMLPDISIQMIELNVETDIQKSTYNHFIEREDEILKKILRTRQSLNNAKQLIDDLDELEDMKDDDNEQEISVKIKTIKNIISNIPSNDKILIFSFFTKCLRSIYNILDIPLNTERDVYIKLYTGDTPIAERAEIIEEFRKNQNTRIMLMNLRTGGVGLNLVEANHVILVEPYWNDAEEQQAINRVYRLGQIKQVYVYKLYVKNTIEKWLLSLQKNKKNIASYFIDKLKNKPIAEDLISQRECVRNLFRQIKYICLPDSTEEIKEVEALLQEFEIPDLV